MNKKQSWKGKEMRRVRMRRRKQNKVDGKVLFASKRRERVREVEEVRRRVKRRSGATGCNTKPETPVDNTKNRGQRDWEESSKIILRLSPVAIYVKPAGASTRRGKQVQGVPLSRTNRAGGNVRRELAKYAR